MNFTNFEIEYWNGVKGGIFPNYPEFFEDPESLFLFTLQGILVFVPWTVLDPITDLIEGPLDIPDYGPPMKKVEQEK